MNVKRVPVLVGFDYREDAIGWLEVDMDRLPTRPNFLFSLGFRVLESEGNTCTKFELVCVSPVSDANYTDYLAHLYGVAR